VFIDPAGKETTETYRRRDRQEKGKDRDQKPGEGQLEPGGGDDPPRALLPDGLLPKAVLGFGIVLAVGGMSFFLVGKRQTPARRKMAIGFLMVGTLLMLGSAWLTPRTPWLAAHFDELDTDRDGILTLNELMTEVETTFAELDRNKDGKLTKDEYGVDRPDVKHALAGFVRTHATEMVDPDGVITKEALRSTMTRMFEKADLKNAGQITREEAAKSGPPRPQG